MLKKPAVVSILTNLAQTCLSVCCGAYAPAYPVFCLLFVLPSHSVVVDVTVNTFYVVVGGKIGTGNLLNHVITITM